MLPLQLVVQPPRAPRLVQVRPDSADLPVEFLFAQGPLFLLPDLV